MKKNLLILALLPTLGLSSTRAVEGRDADLFTSPTAGFQMKKAAGWNFLTMEQVSNNRAVARLKDKELETAVREKANAPLVAVTRYPEPHDDLNPSMQVMLRPAGELTGQPPVRILQAVAAGLQKAFTDFKMVQKVQKTKVGGLPAAHFRATYTVANAEGREFHTLSRMWVVPRGKFLFIIGMSGPQEGADLSEEEFQGMLSSIRIDP